MRERVMGDFLTDLSTDLATGLSTDLHLKVILGRCGVSWRSITVMRR